MSELTVAQTPEIIAAGFNVALTRSRFTEIQQEVANIEYTEDNIPHIAETIKKLGKLQMVVNTKHSEGKAEALKVCQMWDTVKREYTKMVDDIASVPKEKYAKLCQDVLARQRQAEVERVRVQSIKDGINNNVMAFSKQISECSSTQELLSIERMINLEKGKSSKYQEFIGEAKERLESLTASIKQQKEIIKESLALEAKLAKAVAENDDETIVALNDKSEEIMSKIEENKILVQEQAINSTLNSSLETATEVFPTIKAKRSVWKWEVSNAAEMIKKMPSWTIVQPNEEVIDNYLAAKKAEGIQGEEFTLAGVRFYLQKTF